jgi:hypothetical protein
MKNGSHTDPFVEMSRRFWIGTYASIAVTAALVGTAIAFEIIDDDSGFVVLFIVSGVLALGQLLNPVSMKSLFLRCSTMTALPIFGAGSGMATVVLLQDIKGKAISEQGLLVYPMMLAGSLLWGVVAGVVGIVISFLVRKISGQPAALPVPLCAHPTCRFRAGIVALTAPFFFASYAIAQLLLHIRGGLNPFITDLVFFAVVLGGAVYVLLGALSARRRIIDGQVRPDGSQAAAHVVNP